MFGPWQEAGDLVGKGYVWSDLSIADKVKFASNPDNNIYKDGENWVQVRYPIRVVKGLGNDWDIEFDDSPRLGLLKSVSNNGQNVALNGDCIPIALVQRRNAGVYSPVYNPEGCGKYYYIDGDSSRIIDWYELGTPDAPINADNETNLAAMFDPQHVAYITPDSNDVTNATNAGAGDVIIGSIASGISGRPDNLFNDEISERDVEDLRMSAHERNYDELLNEYSNKVIAGDIRGKENNFKLVGQELTKVYKPGDINDMNFGYEYGDAKELLNGGSVNSSVIITRVSDGKTGIFISKETNANLNNIYASIDGKSFTDVFGISGTSWVYVSGFIAYTYLPNLVANNSVSNNTLTHTDIIGDVRKLKDRVSVVCATDDAVVTLDKNIYVKCDDDSNNNGTNGHIYRFLPSDTITGVHTGDSDAGDANATDGHIDFSDDAVWLDLGDNVDAGGYKDEWLEHGINASPLLVGEEGESLLLINAHTITTSCYSHSPYTAIKASKKMTGFRYILLRKKDGNWHSQYSTGTGGSCPAWNDDANLHNLLGQASITNNITIPITDDLADFLGYSSKQEMLDLMVVLVTYETKANFLELATNTRVLDYKQNIFATNVYGGYFTGMGMAINKVLVGSGSGGCNWGDSPTLINMQWRADDNLIEDTVSIPLHTPISIGDNSHTGVKVLPYLTESNSRARLQFVFKELKYDGSWGDDSKFQIINNVSTLTDINGNKVLYGQKSFDLPYFIK